MKEILLPINLDTNYENILAYAKSVATRSNARVTFFYAGARRLINTSHSSNLFESTQDRHSFLTSIRYRSYRNIIASLFEEMDTLKLSFRFKYYQGSSLRGIRKESQKNEYDLLILGVNPYQGWRGYIEGAVASSLIGEVNIPVFIVPISNDFNSIEHITYAVDLTAYDPQVIRQVKDLASIFDAKLTIAHVNTEQEEGRESYLNSLEQTVSATLDYPKVYYKFFDHTDIFAGIKTFVSQNNPNIVAMINRKKFSWRELFSPKSLTRKMAQDLRVPILAFSKTTV